ncbi:CDP-diacylglycerol--glycerol-3-phosphate 3-phosphatidyltransferase [Antarcticirhabdus aurantiaca]|uniref:CDP-diacylglycerol--glycerol-3-phosphate 3-phosphatidyltransferase n=1 Tax=Antarcticirhabdus aurantiaca TaxID=2606717 RepID=A0ACD4NUD0_9HYPH|nr:CDP-diacylglycerol--glycerol-3-phosphate 3-phosphatidyltransferase [Antarcticirhabdus aurantiaca]WAJ30458.1 CDP-diacylglycerol--glycerol-3-phosphate 3-phosphatidyltransferase [Jeongeuplla avenae]
MASRAYSLPNILTYARIVAVPLVVLCFFIEGTLRSPDYARWWAFGLFVAASVTDWLDGYLARIWQQTSTIGRMLDPIADKLLVAAALLLLAAEGTIAGWTLWAAIIILCREILVSGLREYLAELKVSVPVTRVAKWKTFIQMLAIAFLLAGPAADNLAAHYFLVSATATGAEIPIVSQTGLVLLWIAAVITLYTGYDYFRAGLRHIED